jgi:hypothetical protein
MRLRGLDDETNYGNRDYWRPTGVLQHSSAENTVQLATYILATVKNKEIDIIVI